jgi:hypothetical protein
MVLQFGDGELVRVIRMGEVWTYYVELRGSGTMPKSIATREIEANIQENIWRVVDDPFQQLKDENSLPDKYKDVRDKNSEVMDYIFKERIDEFLTYSTRGTVINEAAERFNVPVVTVRKLSVRYMQRGMTKNSLLPDYDNCGLRGQKKKVSDKKRGRPRDPDSKGKIISGMNTTSEDEEKYNSAIKKYYKEDDRHSIARTYQMLLLDEYSELVFGKNGTVTPKTYGVEHIPTYHQFYYHLKKSLDKKEIIIARYGEKEYNLNHRPLVGNSMQEVLGPGSKYQIDTTQGKIKLVSPLDGKSEIGKPWFTFAIDVYSRLIAAMYVSLQNPSWISAMMTLENMIADKDEFLRQYGLDVLVGTQWSCSNCLPEVILADKGEWKWYNANNLVNNLNIRVENAPSYRPDLKGIVESLNRSIHERIKALPGATYRPGQPGEREEEAALTLRQLTQIVIWEVWRHNTTTKPHCHKEEALTIDGISSRPIDVWNWGIENRKGGFFKVDKNIARLHFLPKAEGGLSDVGLRFKGLGYTPVSRRLQEQLFVNRKGEQVEVAYDPRNMDNAYIICDGGKDFIACTLTEKYSMFREKSEKEIQVQKKINKNIDLDYVDSDNDTNALVNQAYQNMVKGIAKQNRSNKAAPNKQSVTENRNAAKKEQSEEEIIRLVPSTESVSNVVPVWKQQVFERSRHGKDRIISKMQKKLDGDIGG